MCQHKNSPWPMSYVRHFSTTIVKGLVMPIVSQLCKRECRCKCKFMCMCMCMFALISLSMVCCDRLHRRAYAHSHRNESYVRELGLANGLISCQVDCFSRTLGFLARSRTFCVRGVGRHEPLRVMTTQAGQCRRGRQNQTALASLV